MASPSTSQYACFGSIFFGHRIDKFVILPEVFLLRGKLHTLFHIVLAVHVLSISQSSQQLDVGAMRQHIACGAID